MERGRIFNIQRFCIHDGPGTRTVVFFKGCNLRCFWCHNPEGIDKKVQLQFFADKCISCGNCLQACKANDDESFSGKDSVENSFKTALFTDRCKACGKCADVCYAGARLKSGRDVTAEELAAEVLKDREVYEDSGGGVTFSGGEPLLQAPFLGGICKILKRQGVSVALETAACVDYDVIRPLLEFIDFIYCDLKAVSPELHKSGTGADNGLILKNLAELSASGVNLTLRTPVVPGFNDSEEEMGAIADFLLTLPVLPKYELLPFHGVCIGKYISLNKKFGAEGLKSPEKEKMQKLAGIFLNKGINVKY